MPLAIMRRDFSISAAAFIAKGPKEAGTITFDDSFNHEVWNDTGGWHAVLFVDFARPLRRPWHWLNRSFIGLGPLAPFLREAGQKQKAWEKKFYAKG